MTQHCRRPCTCAAPPVVDLTRAFIECHHHYHHQNEEGGGQQQRQQQETTKHKKQQQELLGQNLKSCGWSHMCLDLSSIQLLVTDDDDQVAVTTSATTATATGGSTPTTNPPSYSLILQNHGRDWKELLVNLFEQQQQQQIDNDGTEKSTGTGAGSGTVVYRVAESGSPDAGMVEPKQSLEVQRCKCRRCRRFHCVADTPPNQEEEGVPVVTLHMQAWTDLFHQVARTVRHVLNFPQNVLLQEEPCRYSSTNSAVHDNNDDAVDGRANCPLPCSVDLLRAFYYETASAVTSVSSSSRMSIDTREVLGSNEHTDWGSFTIVWQDDVEGCLQTYCHACDSWNNVQVPQTLKLQQVPKDKVSGSIGDRAGIVMNNNNSNNLLYLVVHVGDVTSLAIGRQQEPNTASTAATTTESPEAALSSVSRGQRQENHDSPTATATTDCANNSINNDNNEAHGANSDFNSITTTTDKTVIWPSPRHRVCLPTAKQQRRASLVYFAYPPPELSVDSISQALHEWWYRHNTTTTMNDTSQTAVLSSTLPQPATVADAHWIPYQDYYLLRNQAVSAQASDKSNRKSGNVVTTAQHQFEKIASIPLRTVLTEKWNQVQRGVS
jgi:hypothetical protein